MRALIVVEHDQKTLSMATLTTVTAARHLTSSIDALICADQAEGVVEQLQKINGITQILYSNAPHFKHALAEDIANTVLSIAKDYDYIIAAATTFGKNLLPRVAAKLDVAQVSDVIEIVSKDTFKRPIYAGSAIATVQSHDAKIVMTIRPTAYKAAEQHSSLAPITQLTAAVPQQRTRYVSSEMTQVSRPELTTAKIIISGGRGLQNKENFQILERLADRLGAAVGGSRAAVDAGFVPNDYQVGQTGKVVAPDLYIAIGISGAVQHLAGIKDSKVIVAINKDPDAPIFEIADYGLVADFFEILPEFEAALDQLGYKLKEGD